MSKKSTAGQRHKRTSVMCNGHNHSPGCNCGWGGDSPEPRRDYQYSTPTIANGGIRVWREPDFTRSTHCPECGKDVYFIRHNGGSVWVNPPLGWPWPKHACFDKPSEPTHSFSAWTATSSRLTNPKLGIIVRITNGLQNIEPRIEIRLLDASRVTLVLRWTPSDATLLGALVIFSKEDCLLLHQIHAEIPFHSFSEQGFLQRGYYQCPRCKAAVKENTGHEEHCHKTFDQPKPTKIHKPLPNRKTPFQPPKKTSLPNPVLSHRKKFQ